MRQSPCTVTPQGDIHNETVTAGTGCAQQELSEAKKAAYQAILAASHLATDPIREKFYRKVRVGSPADCWPWAAAKQKGYGVCKVAGANVMAHRVAYILDRSSLVPDGYEIDHRCENRACVNPNHLGVVTGKQNKRLRVVRNMWRARASKFCANGHEVNEQNTWLASLDQGGVACKVCYRAYTGKEPPVDELFP